MGFTVVDPPLLPDVSENGVSYAIVTDGLLKVSGQVDSDGDPNFVGDGPGAQTVRPSTP